MGLFVCRIYEWTDLRDSSNRISASEATTGRQFILNTNRISELKDLSGLAKAKSSFHYSENPGDRRESLSYITCDHSAAQIQSHFDDTPAHQYVTLAICPYNHPWGTPNFPLRTPVNTTIGVWSIAIVDRYNPAPNTYVWVTYYKGSFKRMEVLCSLDIGYPSLTSTTTDEQGQGEGRPV
jgi:hypothetical protein